MSKPADYRPMYFGSCQACGKPKGTQYDHRKCSRELQKLHREYNEKRAGK